MRGEIKKRRGVKGVLISGSQGGRQQSQCHGDQKTVYFSWWPDISTPGHFETGHFNTRTIQHHGHFNIDISTPDISPPRTIQHHGHFNTMDNSPPDFSPPDISTPWTIQHGYFNTMENSTPDISTPCQKAISSTENTQQYQVITKNIAQDWPCHSVGNLKFYWA